MIDALLLSILVITIVVILNVRREGVGYLVRCMAWISQGFNLLIGGHHDQTVSARAYIKRYNLVWGFVYRIINMIFFWQEDHCFESHLDDLEFAKEILNGR